MKKIILIISVLLTLQFTPSISYLTSIHIDQNTALAEITDPGTEGDPITDPGQSDSLTIKNPLKVKNIQDLLAAILSAIVQIAIPFLVLAVMWVGFLFVAARGNPNKLADARQALFYTLIGALIILGAQTLSVILSGTISQLTEGVGN
jgi:hypothetical protein